MRHADLELHSLEERRQLRSQILIEDGRLALRVRQRQPDLQLVHGAQIAAAARLQQRLLRLRVHLWRVALQLRELQIGVEVAGLLHSISRLAQRRQFGRAFGQQSAGLGRILKSA